MRRHLTRRCLRNVLPATLIWPFLVLPWTTVLFVASFRKGHSSAVISGIIPQQAAEQETAKRIAENEVSWGRVWVIVAVLFCWVPLFGLPFAILAYLLNRKSADWRRTASILALVTSVLIHVGGVMLLAFG